MSEDINIQKELDKLPKSKKKLKIKNGSFYIIGEEKFG